MFTPLVSPTRSRPPSRGPRVPSDVNNPWLLWSIETPAERELLTVAELAECHCPDLCNRDHDNE
jgi:hypothetical protein